jgi:DNA repair protein RadC
MTQDQTIKRALAILEQRIAMAMCSRRPTPCATTSGCCCMTAGTRCSCACFLDSQHRVLACNELFRGTLAQTSVYPREVVKEDARTQCCAAVVFAHNHPSRRRRAQPRRLSSDAGAEAGVGTRRRQGPRSLRTLPGPPR